MGVAHEWILLYEWVFGDFHFTRIHPWASLFFSVALHITIRRLKMLENKEGLFILKENR
jgi:hypothetical protein